MANILNVLYSDKGMKFLDSKDKCVLSANFNAPIAKDAAIQLVNRELQGMESVAAATVSLMVELLDTPRLDAYKGKCDITHALPKELKEAIRELETEAYKPNFVARLINKGATPGKAEQQWQDFSKALRAGGSYAQAKGKIIAYFAFSGMLPCVYHEGNPDKAKQFTVAAIEKLLQNLKAQAPKDTVDNSIAAQLVRIAETVDKRDENLDLISDKWGYTSGIAALKQLLATFEGLEREASETRTQLGASDDVIKGATDAIEKAKTNKREKKNKGQISPKSKGMEVAAKSEEAATI